MFAFLIGQDVGFAARGAKLAPKVSVIEDEDVRTANRTPDVAEDAMVSHAIRGNDFWQ